MKPASLTTVKYYLVLNTIIGFLISVSGLLVITGWLRGVPSLQTFGLGPAPMKPNLGFSFIIIGISLILLQFPGRIPSLICRILSAMLILIGSVTSIEILFGLDLGIDNILIMNSSRAVTDDVSVTMSFNAAISLLFTGIIQTGLSSGKIRFLYFLEFCLVLTFTLSFLGITWFLFGLMDFSGSTGYVNMAVLTTILFMLTCFSLLLTYSKGMKSKITIDQQLFAGLVFVGSTVIFLTLLSASVFNTFRKASEKAEQAQIVKNNLNLIYSDVVDVETGLRGFLISGNEEYLIPIDKAKDDLTFSINNLRTLLGDSKAQLARLDSLEHLILERMRHAEMVNPRMSETRNITATSLFNLNRGKILTARIRDLIIIMKDEENINLKTRNQSEIQISQRARIMLYLNVLIQISLLIVIFYVVRKYLNERHRAINEVQLLNEELEQKVKERNSLLAESEGRFRSLFENSSVGIYRTTPDGEILMANPTLVKLLGFDSFEELAKRNLEKNGFDTGKKRAEFLNLIKKNGEVDGLESAWKKADGTTLFISESARAIYDDNNQIKYFDGIVADISERKKALDALKESEEKFRSIMENSADAIFITDQTGRYVYVNKKATELLGYPVDEILGKEITDLSPEEKKSEFIDLFTVLLKTSKLSTEIELRKKDGNFVDVDLNSVMLPGGLVYGSCRDISKRKKIEEELARHRNHLEELLNERAQDLIIARQEAEDANKAKSEFLANMSHEIRTPMNAVLGYTELLNATVTDQTQKDYINSIKSSGRSLLTLINDILDLSKIEAGKLELDYDYVDTSTFFSEFERIFSLKVLEKGLKFKLEITSGTPPGIFIDEARVRQVIFNLLGNAVKFTKEGTILLKVYTENPHIVTYPLKRTEDLIDLIIEVSDTGIGISKELKELIFEPFSQERSFKNFGGTGLGLTITKRLLSLMNGSIEVQSEIGKGSTFIVKIPETSFQHDFVPGKTEVHINPSDIIFEEAVILVIDDVEHNRKYLKDALKNTQLKIFEAEDGLIALKMARKIKPDLIIADIRMPNMDGFKLLKKIKSDKALKHIPVLAYSASVLKAQKEKIYNSDFWGLLIKPVNITDLYLALMNLLPYRTDNKVKTDDPEEITLASGKITDIDGLIESLRTTFYQKWQTFAVTQPIDEISLFASDLIQLGLRHNSKTVTAYGKELINAAESFNIDALLKLVFKYPLILDYLKNPGKSTQNEQ